MYEETWNKEDGCETVVRASWLSLRGSSMDATVSIINLVAVSLIGRIKVVIGYIKRQLGH